MSLPGHRLLIHSTSFQFSAGSNWPEIHCDSDVDVLHALDVAGDVAEGLALAAQHAQRPGRLGGDVDEILETQLRRHGHAVLDVAVALAEDLQIDREHERAAFGRRGALDQRADEAAVLHDVELEPERLVDRCRDVLDRADRHGRQRERDARRLRGAAGQDFAVAVLHAAQPDRRQRQRQRDRLAEYRGVGAAAGDVDQNALAQLDAFEIGAVGAQRLLRIGAAVGIFEERARHLAAGGLPQILDAGHGFHGRAPRLAWRAFDSTTGAFRSDRRRPRNGPAGIRSQVLSAGPERRRKGVVGAYIEKADDGRCDDGRGTVATGPIRICATIGGAERRPRPSARKTLDEALDRGPGRYLSGFRPGFGHPAAAQRPRQNKRLRQYRAIPKPR